MKKYLNQGFSSVKGSQNQSCHYDGLKYFQLTMKRICGELSAPTAMRHALVLQKLAVKNTLIEVFLRLKGAKNQSCYYDGLKYFQLK